MHPIAMSSRYNPKPHVLQNLDLNTVITNQPDRSSKHPVSFTSIKITFPKTQVVHTTTLRTETTRCIAIGVEFRSKTRYRKDLLSVLIVETSCQFLVCDRLPKYDELGTLCL